MWDWFLPLQKNKKDDIFWKTNKKKKKKKKQNLAHATFIFIPRPSYHAK